MFASNDFFTCYLSRVTQRELDLSSNKACLHYGKVTVDCFQESTYFFIDVFNLKSKLASNDENRSKIQTAQFCIKNVFIQTVNLKKQQREIIPTGGIEQRYENPFRCVQGKRRVTPT